MSYILFDDSTRTNLLPFTHTRAIADIRCGIYTMRERWEHMLRSKTDTLTAAYLQPMYTYNLLPEILESVYGMSVNTATIAINGSVFASAALVKAINRLQPGEKLVKGELVIAANTEDSISFNDLQTVTQYLKPISFEDTVDRLKNLWDIFSFNDTAIRNDFAYITKGRKSASLPGNVIATGKENIFVEEGAEINAGCIINGSSGPVYIGKNAVLLEGAMLRGPIALCEGGVIKMGAKIYGATTIGPGCKVGGEINNAIFFANSNKAHDGYLGNSVIGEWCNLGADTNCSNLKNNYDEVKIWNESTNKSVSTRLTFCGLFMGDHSKCAINTSFNTGTVVGVSCNIFGNGFPAKYIPSFCWGGSEGMSTYDITRALETAERMMGRRNRKLSDTEKNMLTHVFEQAADHRRIFAT